MRYLKNEKSLKEKPEWVKFSQGHLKGINLYLTESYCKSVFPKGEYDKRMFDDFQKNTTHNEVIFDVGGFMGTNSLLFSKIVGSKGKVVSFEPNPHNLKRMLLNFSQNKILSKNISTTNLALGNEKKKADFILSNNVDNGYSSGSRLKQTHTNYSLKELKKLGFSNIQVDIDTLDNFTEQKKIYPDILKIDIEGSEHLLLLGAKKFLKNYSPALYIEMHSQFCTLTCVEILSSLGYKNTILFEEPDNRLLVKFYKENINDPNKKTKISEIERKIIKNTIEKLSNQNNKYKNELNTQQKLNIKITKEKDALTKEYIKIEKYLSKIKNNSLIKTELKIFELLKKTINKIVKNR